MREDQWAWQTDRCPRCGYALTGLTEQPCPECALHPADWSELVKTYATQRQQDGLRHPALSKLWWIAMTLSLSTAMFMAIAEAALSIVVPGAVQLAGAVSFIAAVAATSFQGVPVRKLKTFAQATSITGKHTTQSVLVTVSLFFSVVAIGSILRILVTSM